MFNKFKKHESANNLFKRVRSSKPVTLSITLMPNGDVSVNGPINDKLMSYGLLSVAHDIIKDYKPEQKKIIPVEGEIPKVN